jgi:hypothetical protein
MDTAMNDALMRSLQRYEQAIEDTRANYPDLDRYGTYPAFAPFYERARAREFLGSLADRGIDIPAGIWQEYARISRSLEIFEQRTGPAFRAILKDELHSLTQAYQAALCYAYLCGTNEGSPEESGEREIIGILLQELKKDHDLADLERLITSLDEAVLRIAGTPQETCGDMGMVIPKRRSGESLT